MCHNLNALLLSWFCFFLSCDNSSVHHRRLKGLGRLFFRWSSRTSPMTRTNSSTLSMKSSFDQILSAGSSAPRRWARSSFTLIQFACLKSSECGTSTLGSGRSRIVMIGRWSASGGRMAGMTSHRAIGSSGVLQHQTLSGRVQLPAADWNVGIPFGRARSISFL